MDTLLKVNDLCIQYNNANSNAVNHVSFTIHKHERVSIFGPSGCGKSSIVWALTGMLKEVHAHASGTITFENETIDLQLQKEGLKTSWNKIALVPQSSMSALNPIYTIEQSLFEMMEVHEEQKDYEQFFERAKELLDLVQLDVGVLKLYPHELSGGMKQRVSIAMAILYNPTLLILDEATTGLDLLVEADILGTILEIQNKYDISILMITHDKRLADNFCNRIINLGVY